MSDNAKELKQPPPAKQSRSQECGCGCLAKNSGEGGQTSKK